MPESQTTQRENQKLLSYANTSMFVCLSVFVMAVVLAYGYEENFTLFTVVFFHIAQLLFAGLFKLSYVVRLVAQQKLGLAIR